jgi:muconolactone delta-isomerase
VLYVVISTPAATPPSSIHHARAAYWDWVDDLRDRGLLLGAWSRVGRGAVAIFDVESHDQLHLLVNQWAEMIPASFEVIPVIDPDAARSFLAETEPGGAGD